MHSKSIGTTMEINDEASRTPEVLPPAPKQEQQRPENQYTPHLTMISLIIFFLMAYGLAQVMPGEGALHKLKIGVMSFAMAFLAWVGNHSAIRKGTILAARGSLGVLIACMMWFAVAIGTTGTVTGSGAGYVIATGTQNREPQQEIARVERVASQSANTASRVEAPTRQLKDEISGLIQGEISKGIVSGRPGRGPEVEKLVTYIGKADSMLRNFARGDRKRVKLISKLRKLRKAYETEMAAGGDRSKLIVIYSDAQTTVQELSSVVPTAAVAGLISQLRAHPNGAKCASCVDVGEILDKHADALEATLPKGDGVDVSMKAFPAPLGLGSSWEYLPQTWPLVVFGYALETGALVIWLMVYFEYRAIYDTWKIRQEQMGGDDPPASPSQGGRPEPDPSPIDLTPKKPSSGGAELPPPDHELPDRRQLEVVAEKKTYGRWGG